jgi:hypothetical protein
MRRPAKTPSPNEKKFSAMPTFSSLAPAQGLAQRVALAACAALLLPLSLPAAAQGSDTVSIGALTKRASGTVTGLESGDVACYLNLKDARGASFQEMADFSLCEQKPSLKGKRVALTYKLAKVMSDECQGDMNCKKTKTVALVTAARVLDAAASPEAKAAPAKTAGGQSSFCTPMETVVFACRSGAKLVSVCASKDAARNRGYLQYRFGKPDSADPLEMTVPESMKPAAQVATGQTESFSGGGGAWLRFRNGQFSYVAYTGIGKWGPRGETREKAGVVVERGGKQVANLKCSGKETSELGPDWFGKVGMTAGKDEFDFPD